MLLPQDFDTTTWDRLRASMDQRLSMLRRKNDGNLPSEETQWVRGQIAELKYWLSLTAPQSSRPVPADNFEE